MGANAFLVLHFLVRLVTAQRLFFFTSVYLIDWKLPEGTFSILASHMSTICIKLIGVSTYCPQLCSDLNGPLTRSFRTKSGSDGPFQSISFRPTSVYVGG